MTRRLSLYLAITFVFGNAAFVALVSIILDRPDDLRVAWLLLPLTTGVVAIVFTGLSELPFCATEV